MDGIVFYGTTWCGDCRRVKRLLDELNIPYKFIDIDDDLAGAAYVEKVNHGNQSVPTLLFPDGSLLVEPSNNTVLMKLGKKQ